MRTTLKRGLGRAAPTGGDGRAVLPPGAASPVNVYRQPTPPKRRLGRFGTILAWVGLVSLVLAAGAAGGGYLWVHERVADLDPSSPGVKRAQRGLDVPTADQPAIALVIGYDHRKSDGKGTPSRSDTLMLVRADPTSDSISLLSFPRDMLVEIRCPGASAYIGRINQAYADCEEQGALQTVKALTGLQVNYLITVNFGGFVKLVDRMGGVWLDVDRRYFNDRGGSCSSCYATIDLQPGYQQLSGRQALSYVRFRHTDSDLFRVARQQQFVKSFKSQVQEDFGLGAALKLVDTITKHVEVAQGGGRPVDIDTVSSYARFAYELPRGRVFQTRIEGLEGFAELTTDSVNLTRAIQAFAHPDIESSEKATAVALGEKIKTKALTPRQTSITVLNGNGVTGSASSAGFLLGERGYQILTPPNGLPANAPNFSYFRTEVYYDGGKRGAQEAAQKVANLFGSAVVKRVPRDVRALSNGAILTVVVGQTFHGSLASSPVDQTPRKEKANVIFAPSAARDLVRERRNRVDFPLMVPAVIERSSWIDGERPVRIFWMDHDEKHKALRLVYRMGSNEYWGVQMTDADDAAPVLSDRSHTRRIKGRIYDLYYNGPKLHMVVLRTKQARYWVVNTLLDRLSNETMLAIAKGLRPLPRARR
jgi:LCP family protein required for cell wall assembly